MKHLFHQKAVGLAINKNDKIASTDDIGIITKAKKRRLNIYFIIREVIWRFGKIDYKKLHSFLG